MDDLYVFYVNVLYASHHGCLKVGNILRDLPDDVFIYRPQPKYCKWYLKDMTPVLIEDVPKPIRALVLLMGI